MKNYIYVILLLLSVTASCQSKTVLICKGVSSYAYHDHYCAGLNRCTAKIERVRLSVAKSMNRTPCKFCYKNVSPAGTKKIVAPFMEGQCTAITKKGNRCSRKARSNGHCWQHAG